MRKTESIELTVLCLIEDGDRILLQNRVKNDWHGYALPGGHVEPGESVVDAVIREMKEETGLTVLAPRLVGGEAVSHRKRKIPGSPVQGDTLHRGASVLGRRSYGVDRIQPPAGAANGGRLRRAASGHQQPGANGVSISGFRR